MCECRKSPVDDRKVMESLRHNTMLRLYIRTYYPDNCVLVIHSPSLQADENDIKEMQKLQSELKIIAGIDPGNILCTSDYLLVTLPRMAAQMFVNKHDKQSLYMQVWENGECIHENR